MLPQSLVQNKLIGTDSGTFFTINWDKASQIIDTNFYYTWRLVDESYYYRAAQYPYTLVTKPSSEAHLKLHQYYIDNNGAYVYCINTSPSYQTMSWVPGYYRYAYNEETGYLHPTLDLLPVYVRCPYWGLVARRGIQISTWARSVSNSEIIIDVPQGLRFRTTTTPATTPVLLTTDMIIGRITYQGECIANVPISIIKTPDSTGLAYNYSLSIPNLNYPQNAFLEVY